MVVKKYFKKCTGKVIKIKSYILNLLFFLENKIFVKLFSSIPKITEFPVACKIEYCWNDQCLKRM